MSNPQLIKSFVPGAAIAKHRIVKFGSADGTAIQAAAATDAMFGVSDELGAAATDPRVDVIVEGLAAVEYGGVVTRGDLLTADANGKAVAAAPGAGSNNRTIGIAHLSGVSGDIGLAQIAPGSVQG